MRSPEHARVRAPGGRRRGAEGLICKGNRTPYRSLNHVSYMPQHLVLCMQRFDFHIFPVQTWDSWSVSNPKLPETSPAGIPCFVRYMPQPRCTRMLACLRPSMSAEASAPFQPRGGWPRRHPSMAVAQRPVPCKAVSVAFCPQWVCISTAEPCRQACQEQRQFCK